jgi:hypothetical protein
MVASVVEEEYITVIVMIIKAVKSPNIYSHVSIPRLLVESGVCLPAKSAKAASNVAVTSLPPQYCFYQ